MVGQKVNTGITYLDKILNGGFERGSLIQVTGNAGTGKSTFGLQFAMEGAKAGEKVLYISFEESLESIENTAKSFGWDLKKHKNLKLLEVMPFDYTKASKAITDTVKNQKPNRVVMDTITSLSLYVTKPKWTAPPGGTSSNIKLFIPSVGDIRRSMYELTKQLRAAGSTVLLLSENGKGFEVTSEVLGFICDGILKLDVAEVGTKVSRTLEVVKMRRIKHPLDTFPVEIKTNGISLQRIE